MKRPSILCLVVVFLSGCSSQPELTKDQLSDYFGEFQCNDKYYYCEALSLQGPETSHQDLGIRWENKGSFFEADLKSSTLILSSHPLFGWKLATYDPTFTESDRNMVNLKITLDALQN